MRAASGKPRGARRWLRWLFLWLPLCFVLFTLTQVLYMRWLPPPATSFMANRWLEAKLSREPDFSLRYDWRDARSISPYLPIALVAAEDQNFPFHHGFDFKAIDKAMDSNKRGRKLRGASTISQQLAKNLFLWQGRSYVRKALEVWYTVLIEATWPKRRIIEVYANVVEYGDGIYGAEAAAQHFFHKPAARLTLSESARLAAVLPAPRRYDAGKPGPYVQRRANWIQRQVGHLGGPAYLQAQAH
jgi:monofunctional biosynthetic peptidoglycan transglycosylase